MLLITGAMGHAGSLDADFRGCSHFCAKRLCAVDALECRVTNRLLPSRLRFVAGRQRRRVFQHFRHRIERENVAVCAESGDDAFGH